MSFRFLWLAFIGLFLVAACAGRPPVGEYTIRGYEVSDLFPEPRLQSLAAAACDGSGTKVKSLVESGVDPNGFGEFRETALLWALHCRSLRGVEALLENGAEPEQRAVRAAAHIGNPAFLEAVLKAGGNADDDRSFRKAIWTMGGRYDDWRHYDLLLAYQKDQASVDLIGLHAVETTYCRALTLLNNGYSGDISNGHRVMEEVFARGGSDFQWSSCFLRLRDELDARMEEGIGD